MASSITVLRDDDEGVLTARKSAGDLLEIADTIFIDSTEMAEIGNDALSSIAAASKELEARKASVLDPLNAAVKAMRALFKPTEDVLDTAKATLKRKLAAWYDAEREARLAAERAAQAKHLAEIEAAQTAAAASLEDASMTALQREEALARAAAAEVAPLPTLGTQVEMGANSGVRRWKAEVVDLPALLHYLAADAGSITPRFPKTVEIKVGELQRFASATKGTVSVPGVRFVQETSITARSL